VNGQCSPASTLDGRRSLILRARWLLPESSQAIEHAWLRCHRGRVTGIGSGRPPAAKRFRQIDLGDAVITPGLINAHTHLEFSALDEPFRTNGGLAAWIERVVAWRRQQLVTRNGERLSAIRRGLQESAADGVVAIGEITTDCVPAAILSQGPRLRVFKELLGLGPMQAGHPPHHVTVNLRDAQRLSRAGIAIGLSPHAPYSTQWPLGQLALRAARQLRQLVRSQTGDDQTLIPLAMHLAESADEDSLLTEQTGPFRDLFQRLGVWPKQPPELAKTAHWVSLLARADRGLVVHGTHLPDDPIAMARLRRHRHRLAVAVCPRTTLALAGRLPPVAAFQAAGLRICLGTDGRGSTPDLSLRAEARCLIEAGAASPAEALEMVTRNAAWALGFERKTGQIAVGRPADMVVLRPGKAPSTAEAATAAIFAADTEVVATLRGGRLIAGRLTS
jgi:cytosine/adenosine deaminase-related metal-dependent hydrolase